MLTSVELAHTIGVSYGVLADIYTARVSVCISDHKAIPTASSTDNNSYSRFFVCSRNQSLKDKEGN